MIQIYSLIVASAASQDPHVLEGPLIPYRKSKWKKLENALIFINKSKKSVEQSQKETYSVTNKKRSKWILLKNILSAVNLFSKLIYIKLELENSGSRVH